MTEFYSSYIVGDAPLDLVASSQPAQLAQPTGETVMRTNQRKTYTDVLDEDGNPTGEQVFAGYEYFDEEVEEPRGGWVLEADGLVEDAERAGKVVTSTAEVLDAIAANPDIVEVSRFDENGNAVVPDDAAVATRTDKNKGKDKPTKAERKAAKNQKLKDNGFKELPEDVEADSGEAVEAVFQQMDPNYKFRGRGSGR